MAYEFDVFLSYCRSAAHAVQWTRGVLLPLLEQQLHLEADRTRVFCDERIESGAAWPEELQRAILRSEQLVAVLSPQYFRSPWCRAELDAFKARSRACGAPLVWPLQVFDGREYHLNSSATSKSRITASGASSNRAIAAG